MSKFTYDYIVDEATDTSGLNNSEIVRFHMFNPNGIFEKSSNQQEQLLGMLDRNQVMGGFIVASDDEFYRKSLRDLLAKKRVNTIELSTIIELWEKHLVRVAENIAKIENQKNDI